MKSVFLLKLLPTSTATAEVALYWQTRFRSFAVLIVIPAFSLNVAQAQVISLTDVKVSGCYLDASGTKSPATIPFLNLAATPFNVPMSSTFTLGSHVKANRNLSAGKQTHLIATKPL